MEGTNKKISLDDFGDMLNGMVSTEEPKETNTIDVDKMFSEEQESDEEEIQTTDVDLEQETEFHQQPNTTQQEPFFKNIVNSLIDSGDWEDLSIEHNGKVYESLKDLAEEEGIDEELFKSLLLTQQDQKDSKLKENSVVLNNVDDTRKKIIEAIATGLPHEPILQTFDNFIEPLKKLDLSDDSMSAGLLAKYYKEVKKYDDDYIHKHLIPKHVADLNLTETAEDVRKQYLSSFESILQEQQQEIVTAKKAEEEKLKEEKKNTRDLLKNNEYADPFIKKGLDLLYNKDQEGQADWVKEIQNKLTTDPNFKVDFVHWMLDKEDYINKKRVDEKRQEKLKVLSTAELRKQKSNTDNTIEEQEQEDNIFGLPLFRKE